MSNAVASALLSAQPFPLPTAAGPVLFELLDASGAAVANQSISATAADTGVSATFSNVVPGTYTVRVTRQDAAGNPLATPVVSAPFNVAATQTTITIPTSVDVSVS
jgi:hypothetical protein